MPKFTIKILVTNTGYESVTAHVGASLVGASDHIEYYNTSEDYKHTFGVGESTITRYLTSDLGAYQKYYLYVALWEAEKPIGTGKKYAMATVPNVVEKKRKINPVKLKISVSDYYPTSFTSD